MHISHDFIATKTCPSYEFLVVFGQVRVWDRKSAGRGGRGLGWSAGRVRVRSVRVRGGADKISQTPAGAGRGGFKFCGCGAGADTKFQAAQDSSLYSKWFVSFD